MRLIAVFTTLFLLVFYSYSQSTNTKDFEKNKSHSTITEKIAGQWKLDHIVDVEKSKDDGTQSNNGMQMIAFEDDARYKLNRATTSVDSGSYTLNEQNKTLILQSDITDNTPSEWIVGFKKKSLILISNDESSKRYQYYYKKSKQKSGKKGNKK